MPTVLLCADIPHFTIEAVNDAYCQVTGRSRESLVRKGLFEAFPANPDDRNATSVVNLSSSLSQAVHSRQPHEIRFHRHEIKKDGDEAFELRYWNLHSIPLPADETSETRYILHTVNDVTGEFLLKEQQAAAEERTKKSEQILESAREEKQAADESNALLHAIVDTAQAGIFLFTPIRDSSGRITDFRFVIANKMLAAYVGQTPEVVTGALGSEWFPGYKTNGLFEKYSHTADTGMTNRFEFHYDNDGIDVWLDIMSTFVNGDVLVTFTDYTAMKNLQRRLEEHVAELRGSNANLEQFAYIASHDLQEPLRKVKSFGDMLQSRYGEALGSGGADLIARMQSAAARMSTLIEDLLTYSRASVKPADMQVVDANKVLDGVLFDLERVIHTKKAIIRRDKLQPIVGQATQIGQIFLNLIGNALKFHAPGSTPEISISSTVVTGKEAGIWTAESEADKRFQQIRVADNGIGFDITYRDRIFQIFQRLNTRSDYAGSGVGLSIVKKVVENHGGYIDAVSEPGKGATFTVLLPMVEGELSSAHEAA